MKGRILVASIDSPYRSGISSESCAALIGEGISAKEAYDALRYRASEVDCAESALRIIREYHANDWGVECSSMTTTQSLIF